MDKVLPYLLLVLIVMATWNETLSNRLRTLVGEPKTGLNAAEVRGLGPGQARPTPFWQEPGYRTVLEKAEDALQKRQQAQSRANKNSPEP